MNEGLLVMWFDFEEYEKINYLSYITGCLENSFEFLLKKIAKENNWIEKYRLFFSDSFSFK